MGGNNTTVGTGFFGGALATITIWAAEIFYLLPNGHEPIPAAVAAAITVAFTFVVQWFLPRSQP